MARLTKSYLATATLDPRSSVRAPRAAPIDPGVGSSVGRAFKQGRVRNTDMRAPQAELLVDRVGPVVQGKELAVMFDALSDRALRMADEENELLARESIKRTQDGILEAQERYYQLTGHDAVAGLDPHRAEVKSIVQKEMENVSPQVRYKTFPRATAEQNQADTRATNYSIEHRKVWKDQVDQVDANTASEEAAGSGDIEKYQFEIDKIYPSLNADGSQNPENVLIQRKALSKTAIDRIGILLNKPEPDFGSASAELEQWKFSGLESGVYGQLIDSIDRKRITVDAERRRIEADNRTKKRSLQQETLEYGFSLATGKIFEEGDTDKPELTQQWIDDQIVLGNLNATGVAALEKRMLGGKTVTNWAEFPDLHKRMATAATVDDAYAVYNDAIDRGLVSADDQGMSQLIAMLKNKTNNVMTNDGNLLRHKLDSFAAKYPQSEMSFFKSSVDAAKGQALNMGLVHLTENPGDLEGAYKVILETFTDEQLTSLFKDKVKSIKFNVNGSGVPTTTKELNELGEKVQEAHESGVKEDGSEYTGVEYSSDLEMLTQSGELIKANIKTDDDVKKQEEKEQDEAKELVEKQKEAEKKAEEKTQEETESDGSPALGMDKIIPEITEAITGVIEQAASGNIEKDEAALSVRNILQSVGVKSGEESGFEELPEDTGQDDPEEPELLPYEKIPEPVNFVPLEGDDPVIGPAYRQNVFEETLTGSIIKKGNETRVVLPRGDYINPENAGRDAEKLFGRNMINSPVGAASKSADPNTSTDTHVRLESEEGYISMSDGDYRHMYDGGQTADNDNSQIYPDVITGKPTAGYGHEMTAEDMERAVREGWTTNGVPRSVAEQWLKEDIAKAEAGVLRIMKKRRIDPVVLTEPLNRALTQMGFQMGLGTLNTFKDMWKAIKREDTIAIAEEMLWAEPGGEYSDWRKQTPNRVRRVVRNFLRETGVSAPMIDRVLREAGFH